MLHDPLFCLDPLFALFDPLFDLVDRDPDYRRLGFVHPRKGDEMAAEIADRHGDDLVPFLGLGDGGFDHREGGVLGDFGAGESRFVFGLDGGESSEEAGGAKEDDGFHGWSVRGSRFSVRGCL